MSSQPAVWRPAHPPRVGISSCLLGERVRYNGGHKRDTFLSDALSRHVEWVPVCPEVEIGLGTPRETLRVVREDGRSRLVSRSGVDHTDAMESFAHRRIAELEQRPLCGYVLKSKSPSCGLGSVAPHTDDRLVDPRDSGLYASVLADAEPLLAMEEERHLHEAGAREHFVERLFAHARLEDLFNHPWKHADLIDFHTRHELQLMAHSPELAKEAGRVAAGSDRPDGDLSAGYRRVFLRTLAIRATRGRNVNALQHSLSQIDESLDAGRRRDIAAAIASYGKSNVALRVPIELLANEADVDGPRSLRLQTYFAPFPQDLGLREHV